MDWIISLLERLTPYGTYSYAIMFGILIACGFGLPMPEDIVLVTGGILASRDVTSFGFTFIVCMAGVLIGDGTIYFIGRRAGPRLRSTRFFRFLVSEEREKKVMSWFANYGDKVIFFARFAPGLRMPLFLTSGIYQVPAWKFFTLDGFAAVISVPVWIWVGYFFGKNLEVLESKIHQFQTGIYAILAVLLVGFVAAWYIKKRLKARYL